MGNSIATVSEVGGNVAFKTQPGFCQDVPSLASPAG